MSRLFAISLALLLTQACALSEDSADMLGLTSGDQASLGMVPEPEADAVPTSILECELPLPCDVPFEGKTAMSDTGAVVYNASDLCAFQILGAGERALVQTATEFVDQVAFLDYAVIEPGIALQQAWGISDIRGQWQRNILRCELQPPEFFTACALEPAEHCSDPEMWVRACAPLDILVCPR